jgi:hypothetical protein
MPASGESTMQAKTKIQFKIQFLAGFCAVALSLGFAIPEAQAQSTSEAATQAEPSAKPKGAAPTSAAKRYFVEFRSRSALSYGHTFLVHGKLNAQGQVGQVTAQQVVGLHPFSESSLPWTIGHVIPVIAEHGFSDGDIEDEYITARYRVLLTEAEYADVVAFIRGLEKRSPLWHAVLYNCAAYVGDVAKHMGLKVPASSLLFPEDYIKSLAELNGGTVQPLQPSKPSAKPTSAAAKPAAPKPTAASKPVAKRTAAAASAATPASGGQPAGTVR